MSSLGSGRGRARCRRDRSCGSAVVTKLSLKHLRGGAGPCEPAVATEAADAAEAVDVAD